MARTWFALRVELAGGRGERFWPRPGRVFFAGPKHTFDDLALAINTAFARWDLEHLYAFEFADGTVVAIEDEDEPSSTDLDSEATPLDQLLVPGEVFQYEFDFGDEWLHLCTVEDELIDPELEMGGEPALPWVVFGAGQIPDQYGLRWLDDEDPHAPVPPDPHHLDPRSLVLPGNGDEHPGRKASASTGSSARVPHPTRAFAWFPVAEWIEAGRRWPDLHTSKPVNHVDYSRLLEAELVEASSAFPGDSLAVAPISVEALDALAPDYAYDPGSSDARAVLAALVARDGDAIPWPPGRNEACWCGSGSKYKHCCGRS